jgi:hypothetical protein
LASRPFGPRRSRRKRHRPPSLRRRLSTTSLTWTSTYMTRSTRIEPSQDSPARKLAARPLPAHDPGKNPSARLRLDPSVA